MIAEDSDDAAFPQRRSLRCQSFALFRLDFQNIIVLFCCLSSVAGNDTRLDVAIAAIYLPLLFLRVHVLVSVSCASPNDSTLAREDTPLSDSRSLTFFFLCSFFLFCFRRNHKRLSWWWFRALSLEINRLKPMLLIFEEGIM